MSISMLVTTPMSFLIVDPGIQTRSARDESPAPKALGAQTSTDLHSLPGAAHLMSLSS